MMFVEQIRQGLEVVGSDGKQVGVVDALVGQLLRLKGEDTEGGGLHFLDLAWVAGIEGNQVRLLVPAAEATQRWSAESG